MQLLNQYSIIVAILMLFSLTGCGDRESRAAAYLEKAQRLVEQKEYAKAQLELRNALRLRENFIEAWILRAKIHENLQEWQDAFRTYNKVLILDGNHVKALVSRGRIMLAGNAVKKAREDFNKAAAIAPENPDVQLLEGLLASADGDYPKAETLFQKVVQVDPDNTPARIALAVLFTQAGKLGEAVSLLEEGNRRDPDSIKLQHFLAKIYRTIGNTSGELGLLEGLAQRHESDATHTYQYAEALLLNGETEKAEETLRARMSLDKDDEKQRTALVLTDLLLKTKAPLQAEQSVRSLVEDMDGEPKILLQLANFLLKQNKVAEAKSIYYELIERYGTTAHGLTARKHLAGVFIKEGEFGTSKDLIEVVLQKAPRDEDALVTRATIAVRERRMDDAISDLRVVVGNSPDAITPTRLLVMALLTQGRTNLATERLVRYIDAAPNKQDGYALLSELYTRLGRADEARSVLERFLKVSPANAMALARLATIELQDNKPDRALIHAQQLQKHFPEKADGYHLTGLIHQSRGDHREAIKAFNEALAIEESATDPLIARARSRIALGEEIIARSELQALLETNPQHPVALNLIGELQKREGNLDAATTSFTRVIAIKPDWSLPYLNIAAIQVAQNEFGKAITTLKSAQKSTNNNATLAKEIAKLYERSKEFDKAIAEYEQLLAQSPDAHDAANNLAMLIVTHGEDSAAGRRALQLASRFAESNNPNYRDTLGWVYLKNGEIEQAIPHLEFAAKATQNPEIQFHLGMAYKKIGRRSDAKNFLEQALAANSEFQGMDQAREALQGL